MAFIIIILYLAFIVFMVASVWKVFTKAGQPGWASIVPIYNIVVMIKIIGKPMWWIAIILLIPIVNYIFLIWMMNLISKSFGKDVGFTLGMLFLPFVFWPILGFGSATYVGPAGAPQGPDQSPG